jgi:Ca-activated chloride channel homolog
MSFQYPLMIAVAAVAGVGLGTAYVFLQRRRTRVLAAAGLTGVSARSERSEPRSREQTPAVAAPGRASVRRQLPPLLFLAALILLLFAVARPQAMVSVPRVAGTVILAFDVSNSMTATDVAPTRLAAAQAAASGFVRAQPDTVDIGVVAFDQGAVTTQPPGKSHEEAIAAINRLHTAGGTSLGQAILASLTTIVGHPVALPDPNSPTPSSSLGYWGSATIVLLSDGEDTGGPDAVAAAELASNAGVHIDTIGIGTVAGTTIEVDGYQLVTTLDEDLLTQIAQTTAGTYHRAGDTRALDDIYRSLDLRLTTKAEFVELTGAAAGLAVLLLTVGGLLMITWFGRIL